MMERETDLLNLGICGDGTRMNVVYLMLPNLRLKLTPLLGDDFLGLDPAKLDHLRSAENTWLVVQITLFFFLICLHAQEGSSVSFFRCYKTKLFGMSLSLKILASGTASDQMPAFVCFWKGICLPIGNLLKEHWTQLSSLFVCSNAPLKRCYCIQFKADRI